MPTNSIQRKLQRQISNLERVLNNVENQESYLKQDLGYKSISHFTYSARKNQLEQTKTNIEESINFLQEFYNKAGGIEFNEFHGTQKNVKAN